MQGKKRTRAKTVRFERPLVMAPSTWLTVAYLKMRSVSVKKKTGSFSLIERVILSAGAMLIFSVSFQIDQMPEGTWVDIRMIYMPFERWASGSMIGR